MDAMNVLTWTFRAAFVTGAPLAAYAAIRYHRRTDGAWRLRPAGVMIMLLVGGLATAFGAVALRVVTVPLKGSAPWLDTAVLIVAALAVWAVIFGLIGFLRMVETLQPDYGNSDQKSEPTESREPK
jgi:uncharacterized membrane protein